MKSPARPIAETLKEIARLRDEPVPEAELELQRQYNVGNYLLSLENAGRTAQRVQDIDLYGLAARFLQALRQAHGRRHPGVDEELAKKYLHPDFFRKSLARTFPLSLNFHILLPEITAYPGFFAIPSFIAQDWGDRQRPFPGSGLSIILAPHA